MMMSDYRVITIESEAEITAKTDDEITPTWSK